MKYLVLFLLLGCSAEVSVTSKDIKDDSEKFTFFNGHIDVTCEYHYRSDCGFFGKNCSDGKEYACVNTVSLKKGTL